MAKNPYEYVLSLTVAPTINTLGFRPPCHKERSLDIACRKEASKQGISPFARRSARPAGKAFRHRHRKSNDERRAKRGIYSTIGLLQPLIEKERVILSIRSETKVLPDKYYRTTTCPHHVQARRAEEPREIAVVVAAIPCSNGTASRDIAMRHIQR